MDNNTNLQDLPEIYCAIKAEFIGTQYRDDIVQTISQAGISIAKTIWTPRRGATALVFVKTGYRRAWYLEDVLTEAFSSMECDLCRLKEIVQENAGHLWIDIAIRCNENVPAITFSGENMQKIRDLCADISVDLYTNCT